MSHSIVHFPHHCRYDTCALATNLRNFPGQRGPVVGAIKAGVGLSSSLYTLVYIAAFQPHIHNYLLFLAIAPAAVGIVCLPLMNNVPYVQRSELEGGFRVLSPEGRFLLALQTIGTLAFYLMAVALANAFDVGTPAARSVMALGVVFLLSPLGMIPMGSGGLFASKAHALVRVPTDLFLEEDTDESENRTNVNAEPKDTSERSGGSSASSLEQALLREAAQEAAQELANLGNEATVGMPSHSLIQCFRLLNFWLMAIICGVGVGCGLAFVNSCSLLVGALDGPTEGRSIVISLFGVASCGGRLIFGVVPEKLLRAYGVPRPVFLAASGFLMAFTCIGIAFSGVPALYALATSAGVSFGAHWSLLPSLSSEIFGLDSFASVYTILQLAPAAASYGFGAMLIASVYSAAGLRHDDPQGSCLGSDCFRRAYLIMAAFAAGAGCLSIWLTMRTMKLYSLEARALRSFDRDVSEYREYTAVDAHESQ